MPGDRVVLNTTLAGRDQTKYDEPHKVRFDRGLTQDSFAFGPHRCVGMHLARRELQPAIQEFFAAISQFQIAPGATIVPSPGPIIQPQSLPPGLVGQLTSLYSADSRYCQLRRSVILLGGRIDSRRNLVLDLSV